VTLIAKSYIAIEISCSSVITKVEAWFGFVKIGEEFVQIEVYQTVIEGIINI
jgi:hypothetical protein